ncbi:ABC transporter permease [Thermus composti]|uniref:ABC transporter permease n=1 Tax=Thermus composti TaxID=532059 RepID=A0ABV6Q2I1_9DEIN|nr:ABC transporter permease [Thermus composti]GGN06277.1 ABC transporter permease [Thermus composti]
MRLELDPAPSLGKTLLTYLAFLLLTLLLLGGLFALYGVPPLRAYGVLLSPLADPLGLAEIARRTIPLLLIGAGLTLAFRVGFFNIGAEGQLLLGAVGAAYAALFLPAGPWTLPLMFLLGGALGGLWAGVAAWLRVRFGANEILTTLMQNYLAYYLVVYLVAGPWKGQFVFGFLYTDRFPEVARLPRLGDTLVHWPTLLLGVGAALGLQLLLFRTPLGFSWRVLGENPSAARYLGLKEGRFLALAALASGALSGLAGVGEVAGIHQRLLEPAQISLGYGFTAILAAWLARGRPGLVLLTAPLLGLILVGGDALKLAYSMPFRVVDVVAGLLLLGLVGAEALARHRLVWRR